MCSFVSINGGSRSRLAPSASHLKGRLVAANDPKPTCRKGSEHVHWGYVACMMIGIMWPSYA